MFCSFGRLRLIMALSEHLDQLSRGPPLYGGAALDVNINASSGLKTRRRNQLHCEFPDKGVQACGPEIGRRA